LRPIYTAATEAAAMEQFLEFAEVRVSATEIGKIVCTSNAIESWPRELLPKYVTAKSCLLLGRCTRSP
jgi:hypothetical protein